MENKTFISFIITIGGDTGWRFTNGPEWHSSEARLLFDSELWDVNRIKEEMDRLDNEISKNGRYCSTYDAKSTNGKNFLVPFINNTKGVYSNPDFIDSEGRSSNLFNENYTSKKKVLRNVDESTITPWSINGKTRNY